MKKLVLFAIASLAASSSFAAHLVCVNQGFTGLTVDVQLDARQAQVVVVKAGNGGDSTAPKKGEKALLQRSEIAAGWINYETSEGDEGRGFQLKFKQADTSAATFRAVLATSEADSTLTWSNYEMVCAKK